MALDKLQRRSRIRKRVRTKIHGTTERPRLSVFKSNKAIYAQLIDDLKGHTIAASSSVEVGKNTATVDAAKEVGKKIAEKAKSEGIDNIVFDRSGYIYHGRVKALADGAREGGLKF